MFKFNMGTTVTQNVSNYIGAIVARCQYTDYISYLVRSVNHTADGAPVERWIGEGDLQQ
jgi:hypothetical protein